MPKLLGFQRQDINRIKKNNLRVLLASAPGTGKTIIALRSLVESGGKGLPALVVCPASVLRNWKKEAAMWAPGWSCHIVEGESEKIPRGKAFYIISWALLDSRAYDLLRLPLKAIVADEAHFAKNPDALRSQALRSVCSKNKGLMLLTGTPIINTKDEMEVLEGLFGTVKPLMIRRLLEEVAPQVPSKKRSYAYIKLPDKHQENYDKADNRFEEWLRDKGAELEDEGYGESEIQRILAGEALTKLGYLRRLLGVAKVPAAADWISRAVRLGEPVVVFMEHQAVVKALSKALRLQRIRHAVIEGSTSTKKRQEYIEGFQSHKYPVLLGTKAAKEGITLHAARHLLFVERYWTSADEEQAEDRIRRIGQKYKTNIWFLHASGTVDDRIDTIIRTKRKVITEAIGSEDIAETETGNVEAVLRKWQSFASNNKIVFSNLGRGKPLPRLPSPKATHAVVFYGKRWKTSSAANWCRMNGYLPTKKVQLSERFKLVVHPPSMFKSNQFEVHAVCKDIKVITGTRIGKKNKREVRAQIRSRGHVR